VVMLDWRPATVLVRLVRDDDRVMTTRAATTRMYVCALDTSEFVVPRVFDRLVTCVDRLDICPDRPERVPTLLWSDDIPLVTEVMLDCSPATLLVRLVRDDEIPFTVVVRPPTEEVRPETAVFTVPSVLPRAVMALLTEANPLVTFLPSAETLEVRVDRLLVSPLTLLVSPLRLLPVLVMKAGMPVTSVVIVVRLLPVLVMKAGMPATFVMIVVRSVNSVAWLAEVARPAGTVNPPAPEAEKPEVVLATETPTK